MTQDEARRDNAAWEERIDSERTMADAILSPFYAVLELLGGEDRPVSSAKIASILRLAVAEGEGIRDGD